MLGRMVGRGSVKGLTEYEVLLGLEEEEQESWEGSTVGSLCFILFSFSKTHSYEVRV